ncbi:phage terminase small subunit (plasmid) [Clostridioides difficile]|uniref:phage terminase small subunit n=1 Tax=Clostridioides difficile TaxID=1496 RepID=UPI0021C687F0|nr:phage terminase small subunit [Clostridioides difficile]UWD43278.1 phage terminase small subunit [Clostridioides difficile]UWD46822.1 phage terminase small subunit [Clostridioides difficile]UWD50705.1 phage terminase small subunit [Clostridioides phage Hain-Saunders-2022a]
MICISIENSNRGKAFEIYKEKNGKIKLVDIAKTLDEKSCNISRWKKVDRWDYKLGINKKVGAPAGNQNALGHEGGAPAGNQNARTHGFLSKHLPADTYKIVKYIEKDGCNSLDILWNSIVIQYANILKSFKTTHVKNKKDHTVDIVKSGDKFKEYQVQHSWDKVTNAMKAQATAFKTLTKMIKDYEELLHKNWELATEEQKSRIEQIKAKTNKLTGNDLEIEDIEDIEAEIYDSN